MPAYSTQNSLLLERLMAFYRRSGGEPLEQMLSIISGSSRISLRSVDWFATNYAKQKFTVINHPEKGRLKVYADYKLKLRAYSKKRFDPFCRWERIEIPYKDGRSIQTTIGQLNFFMWAIDSGVVKYIEDNYVAIERDMNARNSTSRRRSIPGKSTTRKRREELSISASKSIKHEDVDITIRFD